MATREIEVVTVSDSLVRSIMTTASGRDEGLVIQAMTVAKFGRSAKANVTIRNSPCHVMQKLDDRVGFHVDGVSYISACRADGVSFLAWLHKANKAAASNEDYGQPDCLFRRAS